MTKSIREQMLEQKLVTKSETPEAKREAARAARPPVTEKELPPPFEAAARGVVKSSSSHPLAKAPCCVACGTVLPRTQRTVDGAGRCAECAAEANE